MFLVMIILRGTVPQVGCMCYAFVNASRPVSRCDVQELSRVSGLDMQHWVCRVESLVLAHDQPFSAFSLA